MDMKLPRTVAVVVKSDVIGATAVSVPVEHHDEEHAVRLTATKRSIIEAVEKRERAYLESKTRPEGPSDPGIRPTDIPATPLREACERSIEHGDSWYGIAARCGWYADRPSRPGANDHGPDVNRLQRAVGKQGNPDKLVRYDTAVLISNALNLDPVDVGL